MAKKKEDTCCLCGKKRSEVALMFTTENNGHICSDCVEQLHYVNMSIDATKRGEINNLNIDSKELCNDYRVDLKHNVPKPHEIKAYLDQYVIGQDEAKRTLSVAVYNHYKRILNPSSLNDDDIELQKTNCICLGPSGSGKSELARTIAKLLDVPMVIVDSTVFTEAGYVGEDVESMISRLYQAANYDIKKTEIGIIVCDEIDKLCSRSANPSITRDVNGTGVQQAMLKLLEGTDVLVPPEGGRKHPDAKMVKINTSNILFIGTGAFVGLEDIISSRLSTKTIGFSLNSDDEDEIVNKDDNVLKYVESKDIKSYGFIPEMVGRMPVITYVDKLDKPALKRILTEPKNAIIKQYQKLFQIDGVKLTFTDEVYDYIVDKAEANETGARGLRSIVEKIMRDYMFDVPSMADVKEIVIDGEYISKIDKKYKKTA